MRWASWICSFPEFHGIDALVIRDSYSSAYTVDEHTFLVIDNVHALRQPKLAWERRFATCWLKSIDSTCFFWPCSCTIPAKRAARRTYSCRALVLADSLLARLELDAEEREPGSPADPQFISKCLSRLRRDILRYRDDSRFC